jgi:ureidoglycolate hydrolase
MSQPQTTQLLVAQTLTPEAFRAYGQAIFSIADSKPYDMDDAQLQIGDGIPRFYIMRLYHKGRQFSHITRHVRCTQCLGALEGKEWLIALAPPTDAAPPALLDLVAFRIPGNCFIKLNQGTWHAGPYFDQDFVDFYNLELSDTNITDHQTFDLLNIYGTAFEIV